MLPQLEFHPFAASGKALEDTGHTPDSVRALPQLPRKRAAVYWRIRTTGSSPDAPRREIEAPARPPCFVFLGEDFECARDEIAGIGH